MKSLSWISLESLLWILLIQCLFSPFLRYYCSKVGWYYDPHSGLQRAKAPISILQRKNSDICLLSDTKTDHLSPSFSQKVIECFEKMETKAVVNLKLYLNESITGKLINTYDILL